MNDMNDIVFTDDLMGGEEVTRISHRGDKLRVGLILGDAKLGAATVGIEVMPPGEDGIEHFEVTLHGLEQVVGKLVKQFEEIKRNEDADLAARIHQKPE